MRHSLLAAAASLLLGGCVNLAPSFERPAPPLPGAFRRASPEAGAHTTGNTDAHTKADIAADPNADPNADPKGDLEAGTAAGTTAGTKANPAADAVLPWADFFVDPRLRDVVGQALRQNRDLRIAVLNVERAQGQYGIVRSAAWPNVSASAGATRQRSTARAGAEAATAIQYSVELGFSSYELDFFGRVRNLGESALQGFFALEENRRAAQVSLVAQVATAWLTLASDAERLRLAQQTLDSQRRSYDLQLRSFELGGVSGLVLAQAQTTVEAARLDLARYTGQLAMDRHALDLLAGGPLPPALLPEGATTASALIQIPAGLPSTLLQQRPDVLAAEHQLRAADADVGAARAAFFPSISLTASVGTSSSSLADLFTAGIWSFAPRITLPLFNAGRNRAGLAVAQAQRDIAIAGYDKTVQAAFRDVADALAQRDSLTQQVAAQQALTDATTRSHELAQASFKHGASSYLEVLDAQRTLYAAQQASISLRLTEQLNRLALYKSLGGGWDNAAR